MVAGFWLVPESRDPAAPRIDVGGGAFSIAGLSTLIWSIIEAPTRGWTSAPVLAGFAVAAVLLAVFLRHESRTAEPMLNLGYFSDRRFAAGCVSVTLAFFALFGTIFFLTQYLQFVLGYSALEAGRGLIPVATMVIGAPLGIKGCEILGERVVIPAGLGLVAGALLLLSTTSMNSGYGHVAMFLTVAGLGMGLTMAPATEAVMSSLPKDKAGVGSAVNDTTRQVGGALGVAILGSLLTSAYGDRLTEGLSGQPVPGTAQDGLAGALATAAHLPLDAGATLVATAKEAFVHGMDITVAAGAGVVLFGALLSFLLLPARPASLTEPADVEESAPELANV
jgi:hypothetical protein